MYKEDTIAAICTPVGEGGIGIIRVSGNLSVPIANKIFRKKRDGGLMSHRFYYGSIVDPDTDVLLDEAMVVFMKAPNSYTRENVLEIQCHGGYLLVQRVLNLVLKHGARLAEPGEYTKRAFLNGRIDLVQAEAVMDVINGKTETALSLAQNQREGYLSRELNLLKEGLLNALTLLEAYIDFPEEEIGEEVSDEIRNAVGGALRKAHMLTEGFEEGRSLREGVSVLIAGKPNVGKSSLLNTLLREKRAIVSSVPGTTRDVIQEIVNIKGLPVTVLDTAGICATDDPVEREGVELAIDKIGKADLVLFVLDSSRPLDEDDSRIAAELAGKNYILVLNKADQPAKLILPSSLTGNQSIRVSTRTGEGIEGLYKNIFECFIHGTAHDSREYAVISNVRHRDSLEKCSSALMSFMDNEKCGSNMELMAVDLREALAAISEITGETTSEDILNNIFDKFCIGK